MNGNNRDMPTRCSQSRAPSRFRIVNDEASDIRKPSIALSVPAFEYMDTILYFTCIDFPWVKLSVFSSSLTHAFGQWGTVNLAALKHAQNEEK